MYVQKAIALQEEENFLTEIGMPKRRIMFLKMQAVEALREYSQRLTETHKSILWDVLDFTTTRMYGQPTQTGALSELPAQTLCMVLVHWSQQPRGVRRQQLVLRQVWARL